MNGDNVPAEHQTIEGVNLRWHRHKLGEHHRTPEGTRPSADWHEATGRTDRYYITDHMRYGRRGWRLHVGLVEMYPDDPNVRYWAIYPWTNHLYAKLDDAKSDAQKLENGHKRQWVDT